MNYAEMFRPKTNQREVFDYMVRFEKKHAELSGIKGVYPTTGMIMNVFKITKTRAIFYRKMFERKLRITLKAKQRNK